MKKILILICLFFIVLIGKSQTINFGTEATLYNTAGVTTISVKALSSTSFVALYRIASNGYTYARIGTISNNAITWGTAVNFSARNTTYIDVDVISSTSYILAYVSSAGASYLRIHTVSTRTITQGTEFTSTASGVIGSTKIAALSSTLFLAYERNGTGRKAKTYTASGTTISNGTVNQSLASILTADIEKISSSSVLLTYCLTVTRDSYSVILSNITSSSVTVNTAYASNIYSVSQEGIETAVLSSTTFVVNITNMEDGGTTTHGYSIYGTISGTSISYSSPVSFLSYSGAGNEVTSSLTKLSDIKILTSFSDSNNSGYFTLKVGDIVDGSIVYQDNVVLTSYSNTIQNSFEVSSLSETQFINVYPKTNNYAYAKTGYFLIGKKINGVTYIKWNNTSITKFNNQ